MKEIAEQLQKTFNLGETASFVLSTILIIFFYLALIVFCYFLWKLVQKLIHAVFRKIEEKKGRSMSLEFLERLVSFGVTFFFIILPFNWDDIGQSVFSSAAVLTAVIGFAAQDVIKDILAELNGTVAWGGNAAIPKESHFEIAVRPGDARLKATAAKIRGWDEQPGGEGAGIVSAFS